MTQPDKTTKVRIATDGSPVIFCPGCKSTHLLRLGVWSYNGNAERPTFSPSLLFTSGHYVRGEEGKPCWCTFEQRFPGRKLPESIGCHRCHSFVRDGMMQFLGDTSHSLAGQTVPVPDWPYAPGTYGGIQETENAES